VAHVEATIDTDPDGVFIFVVDQLDTHMSASLVEMVARCCGIDVRTARARSVRAGHPPAQIARQANATGQFAFPLISDLRIDQQRADIILDRDEVAAWASPCRTSARTSRRCSAEPSGRRAPADSPTVVLSKDAVRSRRQAKHPPLSSCTEEAPGQPHDARPTEVGSCAEGRAGLRRLCRVRDRCRKRVSR
jgi:hypothetical protein